MIQYIIIMALVILIIITGIIINTNYYVTRYRPPCEYPQCTKIGREKYDGTILCSEHDKVKKYLLRNYHLTQRDEITVPNENTPKKALEELILRNTHAIMFNTDYDVRHVLWEKTLFGVLSKSKHTSKLFYNEHFSESLHTINEQIFSKLKEREELINHLQQTEKYCKIAKNIETSFKKKQPYHIVSIY